MHIASLEAHTTLNTYNLWKLALRDHLYTDAQRGIELVGFCSRERCLNRPATAPLRNCSSLVISTKCISKQYICFNILLRLK